MPILKALFRTCHPLPSLAVTAMFAALIVQAAPHGLGPAAAIPAVLLGEMSIGWSNDYFDAPRDAMAGRTDKPIVSGGVVHSGEYRSDARYSSSSEDERLRK